MHIVGQTWLNLVTLTCGSWREGQHDLYFTVQWFCLISWRLFDVCTSHFGIVNQYDPRFDLKINVGHYGLVSWRLLDVSLFGIMNQYDPTFDLKIIVGHCDLYFMVQWFCIISLRLFDIWTPYFWNSMTRHLTAKYFMVQWFCHTCISWGLFDLCTSYFGIMNQYDPRFDLKINVSFWPIFYGPVILPCILKTI